MDDVNDHAPAAAKSIDPAALEMLAHADDCGIETAFSRADHMKPCPIGESGACCRICSMGPCRLVGKDAEEKTGICGADLPTIAARHFARQVAGGVAAHSDHGRDMAMTLRAVATGEAAGYKVRDEQKLMSRGRLHGHRHRRPRGQRDRPRRGRQGARAVRPAARRDHLHASAPRPSARRSGASSGSRRAPSTARSPRCCTAPTRASTSTPRTSSRAPCAARWPTAGAAPC